MWFSENYPTSIAVVRRRPCVDPPTHPVRFASLQEVADMKDLQAFGVPW